MLVLWSGGCDSTLVLLQALQKSTPEDPVRTLSIIHPQVWSDSPELMARTALWQRLKKDGHNIKRLEIEIKHDGEFSAGNGDGGLPQPPIWLATAIPYLRPDEDLYMGYIRGDDIWHYIGWLHQAFNGMKGLLNLRGSLQIPLEWKSKADVIREFGDDKFKKYLEFVWHCESPKGFKECGECASCERHAAAVKEVEKGNKSA